MLCILLWYAEHIPNELCKSTRVRPQCPISDARGDAGVLARALPAPTLLICWAQYLGHSSALIEPYRRTASCIHWSGLPVESDNRCGVNISTGFPSLNATDPHQLIHQNKKSLHQWHPSSSTGLFNSAAISARMFPKNK